MKIVLLLIAACTTFASVSCSKTNNSLNQRSSMDAIADGTFATDKAMQEERHEQGNYIKEQEQRYEE
ncbi:MAG: hypothetical protein H8E86_07945 [Planctomycetes bacterium]|nr:hypothetical protein [Planctomycetota bacterium]